MNFGNIHSSNLDATFLSHAQLRTGMLGNLSNIILNDFLPGAIIQPLLGLIKLRDGKCEVVSEKLKELNWTDQGDVRYVVLHYCDAMLMRESQSLAMLTHLDLGAKNSHVTSEHGETWLVLSGELNFKMDGANKKVCSGDMFIVPPNSTFEVGVGSETYALTLCSEMRGRSFEASTPGTIDRSVQINIASWTDLSDGKEPNLRHEVLDSLNWCEEMPGFRYAYVNGESAVLVQAVQRTAFTYEVSDGQRASLAGVVLNGVVGFEREILTSGTLLHLPSDFKRFDFALEKDSLLLLAAAIS